MEHETQLVNMYQHYSCVSRQVDGGYIIRLKNGDGSGGGPEGGRHHIGLKDTSHLLKRRVKKKKKKLNINSIQFNGPAVGVDDRTQKQSHPCLKQLV